LDLLNYKAEILKCYKYTGEGCGDSFNATDVSIQDWDSIQRAVYAYCSAKLLYT
jgi:hypothetical protein